MNEILTIQAERLWAFCTNESPTSRRYTRYTLDIYFLNDHSVVYRYNGVTDIDGPRVKRPDYLNEYE